MWLFVESERLDVVVDELPGIKNYSGSLNVGVGLGVRFETTTMEVVEEGGRTLKFAFHLERPDDSAY